MSGQSKLHIKKISKLSNAHWSFLSVGFLRQFWVRKVSKEVKARAEDHLHITCHFLFSKQSAGNDDEKFTPSIPLK